MAIEYEEIRVNVDSAFRELIADLDVSYYKNWKLDQSRPWLGFDYYPGEPTKSHIYFDLLHGFVFHLHSILLENINSRDGIYDKTDRDGKGQPTRSARKAERLTAASDTAKAWMPEADILAASSGLDPIDWVIVKNRVKTSLNAISGRDMGL